MSLLRVLVIVAIFKYYQFVSSNWTPFSMRHFTVGEKLALILTFEKANLNFKTLSLNVRGFRSQGKRKALLIWFGKQNADVNPRTYMPTHTPTVVQGKEGVVHGGHKLPQNRSSSPFILFSGFARHYRRISKWRLSSLPMKCVRWSHKMSK